MASEGDHPFSCAIWRNAMQSEFNDRLLTCVDCHGQFIFTAGEQIFFLDKQFKNDPKRCKPCKAKRAALGARPGGPANAATRTETRTECSECHIETTVPFKPTQGRPVLCRSCFQGRRAAPVENSAEILSVAASFEMSPVTTEAISDALLQPQA
jgi:CxxC-x17-CxxC domain-containing protein